MKNITITQKLIIAFIIISLLPYAVISYSNYSAEKDAIENKVFDGLGALAEAKGTHISTVVNFRIAQVREVSTSGFMQEIESKNTSNINFNLLRVKKEIPEFFELSALDLNGTVIASTESGQTGKSHAEEELFKKARENVYIGGIEYYDNRTGYSISSPVFKRDAGILIGVVAVRVTPRFIYDVTGDYAGLGESGESLLVQRRGNEVVFLNPLRHNATAALRLSYPLDSEIALPAILAAEGGKGTIKALDYRGKEVFAAYTYIPIIDWGLVVKMDSSEALIPVNKFRDRAIALGIFYFALVAALAYLFGRRYTAPIRRLSNASKKVAKGDLTVRIEPESRDEIGELAQSFNIMVQRLREFYERLELKVDERTRNLNRRNLELAALIKTIQSISAGLDLNKVLEIAVKEAVRIFNVSYCSIVLVEEGKEYGTVASEYSRAKLKPSLGEILHLNECPTLNEAFQEKRYVLVADARKAELSPREREMAERLNMRSILVVPLVLGEKTLGTMQLSSLGETKEFTKEEINICQTIANQVAIAIENAHLFSELKQHDKTLEILFDIDRVVSQSLFLDELLKAAIDKSIEVTSSNAGWIYLLQEDGETLTLEAYRGISEELVKAAKKLKVGQGVSGLAVNSGKPVTMDIENYPYPRLLPLMMKNNITSLVGVPLVAKGKTIGALVLSSSKHRVFSKDDIDVLSSIGSQIGVAFDNARLYSELRRHSRTMEILFEIDRVVSQSLNLEEIFKEALAKTLHMLSLDAGGIYLVEDETRLKLKTLMGASEAFARAVSELQVGVGVAGAAVRSKMPVVTDIDHYPSRELLPFLEKEGLVTLIGVPLMAKGRVVGAMNLANRRRRAFSKEDIDILASIGSQIGVAIENARLYQESKVALEKLQAAYEELKSLDRMKSEFLSNISHELKTPLVSNRGYGELLYDEKLGTLPQAQKSALEAIIRNADRLTRLINSLLFLSVQQMGKPEIKMKPKPQDIDEIIAASIADMRVQAERKNISVGKDVSRQLMVMGDKDRLTEVFMNLIDNAIKFSYHGGKINIKAREEEGYVHVTVMDAGIGIPENVLPFLFQRFYQADASITRKYGGTGLGLYICKSIVDAHNGKIWIDSKVGKGTIVHVLLPQLKSQAA